LSERPPWYGTKAKTGYDDQANRDKLARLTDDLEPFDDDRRTELDELDAWEICRLLIPTEELPGSGNLRTECDQLVMPLCGDTYDTVELRWICYMKHTDVELRTFDRGAKGCQESIPRVHRIQPSD
jgi:hypothetical protein